LQPSVPMNDRVQQWGYLDTPVKMSLFWSLVLTILPVISAFVVSWLVARFAGPTVWGTVTWTMAFATTLLIVAKLGLELGTSRLASEYGVERMSGLRQLFKTGFEMRAVVTFVTAGAAFALAAQIAGWFGDATLMWPVRAGAVVVLSASAYEFQEQFLIGLNRHAIVSRVRALTLLSRVIVTVAILGMGLGAAAILFGYVGAWFVGIAVFTFLLRRSLPPSEGQEDRSALRSRLLAISIPLAVSSASVTIYSQMDKLMLGYFDNVEEVGQYAIARAVTDVSLFPAFALVMTLRPALAARFPKGALGECSALIRRSLRLSLAAGVMFASVLAVLAAPLFRFVYTEDFGYAGGLMAYFVWVIVLRSIGVLILPALIAAERTKTYAVLTTVSAALNFGLNLAFIPLWHARGAVLATIISYGFLMVFGLHKVFGIFGVRPGWRSVSLVARTVLAGVACSTVTWLMIDRTAVGDFAHGWIALVLAAAQAVAYVGLAFVLGVVRRSDIASWRSVPRTEDVVSS